MLSVGGEEGRPAACGGAGGRAGEPNEEGGRGGRRLGQKRREERSYRPIKSCRFLLSLGCSLYGPDDFLGE